MLVHPCGRSFSQNVASKPCLVLEHVSAMDLIREPILSEWKHHSQEDMIPNELNMTQMARHPAIGLQSLQTKAIIHGT
jgi:hypothetical protein